MKQINKTYSTLIGFFLILNSLSAQKDANLTLKQALQYALTHKTEALKGELDIKKSGYQINEAKGEILPNISADGNLLNNSILQETALPGEILGEVPGSVIMVPFGQKWNADAGISLTQKIFDQKVFIGLKAAKTSREFYRLNKKLADEDIIEKVASQYYNVLILQAQLKAIDTNYHNTLKIQKVIQKQFENGLAKGVDVKRVQVEVFNLQANFQELTNSIQINKNILKFLIGLPMDSPIILSDESLDVLVSEKKTGFTAAKLMPYQSLAKQKELLIYEKQKLKAAYYPTLSLNAQYHYQGLGDKFPIGAGITEQVYWTDYANISLNLHIPIFSGFKTRSKVRQADIDLEKIAFDIKDQKLSLQMTYENAINQIRNSEITIKNQEQNIALAKQVVEETQNNYTNGLASLVDVLDAETSLTEAQDNYNKALLHYRFAQLEYLKSKGELQTLLN